jgi:hypothetical protein
MLHISNGRYGLTSTCGVLYDFNEGATNHNPPSARAQLRTEQLVSMA